MTTVHTSGQSPADAMSQGASDFVNWAAFVQSEKAQCTLSDGQRLHCWFGLDTILWRTGDVTQLYWENEWRSTGLDAPRWAQGIEDAAVWMDNGVMNVLGGRQFLTWGNALHRFVPGQGWSLPSFTGSAPKQVSGRRVRRLSAGTIEVVDFDGTLYHLDLANGAWRISGVVKPELPEPLGDFVFCDLADYTFCFGISGGGVLDKQSNSFVPNADLTLDRYTSAMGRATYMNVLTLYNDGDLGGVPEVRRYDAERFYQMGTPQQWQAPIAQSIGAQTFGWPAMFGVAGLTLLLGLLLGFRKRHVERAVAPMPVLSPYTSHRPRVPDMPEKAENEVLSEILPPSEVPAKSSAQAKAAPKKSPKPARKKRPAVSQIRQRLIDKGNRTYTSEALNAEFGIEPDASSDSQRARRARIVRQINKLHVAETGGELIVRERGEHDRRHLMYRVLA